MWKFVSGKSPLIATAIHSGHDIDRNILKLMKIPENVRLREEDPFIGKLTDISDNRIIVNVSRFWFDLNRPAGKEIYLEPNDAWDLDIWKKKPNSEILEKSKNNYRRFYQVLKNYLDELKRIHDKIVIFDLHSYNHHRLGKDAPFDDPTQNPEIIVGTSNMDETRWKEIISLVMKSFSDADYFGRKLDVRKNVKYPGGNFARWIHKHFPKSICVFSIEIKKIFMDEWTGILDPEKFAQLHIILRSVANDVLAFLQN